MIPEKPTITSRYGNIPDYIALPLEQGYTIEIEVGHEFTQVFLSDARGNILYKQPWRTDAIRNSMDAMVRNECRGGGHSE